MTWTTHIQWKGTDLCMDFSCPVCGAQNHFDGFFAYFIRCPQCSSIFRMATEINIEKVDLADTEGLSVLEPIYEHLPE